MILKKLDFQNMEDLYAAMGYGGITVRKVISRITDEHNRMEKQARGISRPLRETKPTSGVIVEGIDNCLVKFARCCTPIPGDDIIGFITKGLWRQHPPARLSEYCRYALRPCVAGAHDPRHLGVHTDGTLSNRAPGDGHQPHWPARGRRDDDQRHEYQMSSVSARAESGSNTIIDLVVNLRSAEQLGSVMLRLKRIQGVSDVSRVVR